MQAGLKTLLAHPIVGDVRGVGLVAGIEYVQDKATKEWFPPAVGAAAKVRDEAFERGVFVRLLGGGHCHAMAPPFIITHGADRRDRPRARRVDRDGREGARLLAIVVVAGERGRVGGAVDCRSSRRCGPTRPFSPGRQRPA